MIHKKTLSCLFIGALTFNLPAMSSDFSDEDERDLRKLQRINTHIEKPQSEIAKKYSMKNLRDYYEKYYIFSDENEPQDKEEEKKIAITSIKKKLEKAEPLFDRLVGKYKFKIEDDSYTIHKILALKKNKQMSIEAAIVEEGLPNQG